MKEYKKIIALIWLVSVLLNGSIPIFAHQNMLLVGYDGCSGPTYDEAGNLVTDGEDETWYWLEWNDSQYHLSHDTQTIKYYFADNGKYDSSYTWTTDTTESEANDIKEAFANSMKKWNDIYYYSYDSNGNKIARKVITVVEGSETDHNLIIYPAKSTTFAAQVYYNDETNDILETNHNNIDHYHPENWYIEVDVDSFVSSNYYAIMYRERTGQHELGHILGIYDVDVCCSATAAGDHHEEILMGYGNGMRSTYAKYKDIAGVSITRGFHTDSDHIWMLRRNTDGTNDVICSLCNGVRYNVSLSADGTYENQVLNMYRSCTHHNGTNHDMLLVATDGTRDFYKCQYCRYIFELKIDSEETVSMSSGGNSGGELEYGTQKMYKLNVLHEEMYDITVSSTKKFTFELYDADLKLIYSLSEGTYNNFDIDLTEGTYYIRVYNSNFQTVNFNLSIQPPPHTHEYTEWVYHSPTQHIACCECGALGTQTNNHVVKVGTAINNRGICMFCGAVILLGEEFVPALPFAAVQVTLNGSYILPNGIIVLVDEDIEAYLNGTLVFYDKNDLPVTQ